MSLVFYWRHADWREYGSSKVR